MKNSQNAANSQVSEKKRYTYVRTHIAQKL